MAKGKRNSDGKAPFEGRVHPRRVPLEGTTWEDWTVLSFVPTRKSYGGAHWLCRCACGTERVVRGLHLRRRMSRGCGCRARERMAGSRTRHGHAGAGVCTREYNSWRSMLDRVRGAARGLPKQRHYAGVQVCARWDPQQGGSFDNFFADLGWRPPGTSLDRKSPAGNYEPGNCRWSDASTQNLNKRPYLFNGKIVSPRRNLLDSVPETSQN